MASETRVPYGRHAPPPLSKVEVLLAGLAAALALALGAANLGAPSLWHDELVHTFVGKHIAETGKPRLPGGVEYWNGTTYNFALAAMIRIFGLSEQSVRAPSVVFAAFNVLLTFVVLRRLLGRETALLAAFMLALCPWNVAWSREARFYMIQQGMYLCTLLSFWELARATTNRQRFGWLSALAAAYTLAVLSSYHSILFLSPIGLYAAAMGLASKKIRSQWTILACLIGVFIVVTFGAYYLLMNPLDREAVFLRGGLGGEMRDPVRSERMYYTGWLRQNLSTGFYAVALFGFAAMVLREGRRGFFTALAFWAPLLLLTFFIGYRRFRFMFFCFPLYVAACSYGLVVLARWASGSKQSWNGRLAGILVKLPLPKRDLYGARKWARRVSAVLLAALLLFGARLGLSAGRLLGDSLETASGHNLTLARRHPQWKKPCQYVVEHGDGATVVTTTYLPVLYYVGRVDNWYPTKYVWAEVDEAGMDDLKTLDDFKRYVAEHTRGYYIAESSRFDRYECMEEDVAWVRDNMTEIEEASSEDVTLFAWGMDGE